MMTNSAAQTIAWQAKYDPFGNPVTVTVSPMNNQRLPGQWYQLEDGLAYNWHRTYDPSLGRYRQADPLGFVDGPSVYSYIKSSPIMGIDPSGRHKGDKWYGYNDPFFRWWFHRCYKEEGDADANQDEMGDAYAEWKRRGSPKHKCYGTPPISEPAPSQSPICGPACAVGIAVVGACCVLAPEVCIPRLLLGGAASQ
jgi:RHS repeat-associated protein